MKPEEVLVVLLAGGGALIAAMAALIKGMVLGRLDEIRKELGGLGRDVHRMDVRLTKLEAEHAMAFPACRRESADE